MSKLDRLKWIPILIQAYSDLQVQKALEEQTKGQKLTKKPAAQKPPNVAKIPLHLAADANKTTRSQLDDRKRNARNQRAIGIQTPNFQSIMRELKETQMKVTRLESIHEQLSEMNQHLEQRFEQIMNQIEGKKDRQL